MLTEQNLQEQTFKIYLQLEAEELRQLTEELKSSVLEGGLDEYQKLLYVIKDFITKRVSVIKEADALFIAVQAAREKVNRV